MDILINFLNYITFYIEHNYLISLLFFFIFLLIYNSFSIPGNLILLPSTGYFFGIYIGYTISITSLVLGSLIFFSFSNFFIIKFFPKIFTRYTSSLENYIVDSSFEYIIMLRLIPGPPLFLQNLLLSFLKITKVRFTLSTFIGLSPLTFLLVFIGNQFRDINKIKNLKFDDILSYKFLIFLSCIILLLSIRIYYKKK